MIKVINKIHDLAYSANERNRYKETNKLLWLVANVSTRCCEWLLYFILRLTPFCLLHFKKLDKSNSHIAISLTTFPARIKNVWMTIYCLFHQDVMPCHIVLTLSLEDFPNGISELPKRLVRMQGKGLEIIFVKENLKPHKKYYYVMKEHPDWTIVTVDDDMFYRSDMLSRLLDMHNIYPNAVCANTVSEIAYDSSKEEFLPYSKWNRSYPKQVYASHKFLAIGINGVLYPPNTISRSKHIFDIEEIKQRALTVDDLWLKCNELMANIKVCSNGYYCTPPSIPSTKASALTRINTGSNGRNDRCWELLNNRFNLSKIYKQQF